jgi:hypothetical protein
MGLSIKRAETVRTVRAVAERMGLSVTEAVQQTMDEKLRALTGEERREARRRDLEEWLKEVDARPRNPDGRTWKQIEDEDLYDEMGNPIG